MTAPIRFRQDTHDNGTRHYICTLEDGTELRFPSVTTVLGAVFPKPWLKPWAAKVAIDAVEQCLAEGKELTPEVLKWCKAAHKRKADHGKSVGSQVHEIIERWLGGEDWWSLTCGAPEEVCRAADAWLGWWESQKLDVLQVERTVYSLRHRYAGTADFGGTDDTEILLTDWKTAERWSEDWALQVVAYARAAVECKLLPRVDRICIGRFDKQGNTEVRDSRTDPELHPDRWPDLFDAFLAARAWYGWLRESRFQLVREEYS